MATTKQRRHLDMQHNELQNVKGQNLNATPIDVEESQYWYDTVNHRFKFHNGTAVKDFGKEYTAGTGITIDNSNETISVDTTVIAQKSELPTFSTGLTDTSGTITVTDYNKLIKNTSPQTHSISIGGATSNKTGRDYNIAIGDGTYVEFGDNDIAIGYCAGASGAASIAIGNGAVADEDYSLAIGSGANALSQRAIQIGYGTNMSSNSLKVGFKGSNSSDNKNWVLLNGATGLIPDDRLSTNIARTTDIPTTVAELTDSSNYALTTDIPTTVAELTDSGNYALKTDLNKVYKASGTVASASDLPTLSANVMGNVYNVTASFNTTSSFVEGSGKTIQVGNDIVVVDVGSGSVHSYKFSVMGDFVDISGKQDVIDNSHKLSSDLVDDTNHTNKFVTSNDISYWNGKQDTDTAVTHTSNSSVGNNLKPVYITSNGVATACDFEIPPGAVFTDTDTKNTAGSTDRSSAKLYLIGAETQAANPQTYSNSSVFIDTYDRLNSAAPAANANDTTVATTKWVKDQSYLTSSTISSSDVTTALGYTPCKKITTSNSSLTASGGEVTWEIANIIGTKYVGIHVYESSTGEEIECSKVATDSTITIKMNSSTNVSADTYYAVIIG